MLCLQAGAVVVSLLSGTATLAWMHSVEKTRWEEDWRAGPEGLVLDQARVMGSGAGMDPPPQARQVGAFWAWTPELSPLSEVIMRRSGATADWSVCTAAGCRPMDEIVPPQADPVVLTICPVTPQGR